MLGVNPPPLQTHTHTGARREGHDNDQSIDDIQQIKATGAHRRTFLSFP